MNTPKSTAQTISGLAPASAVYTAYQSKYTLMLVSHVLDYFPHFDSVICPGIYPELDQDMCTHKLISLIKVYIFKNL